MDYEQKYKEAKRLYETANADQRHVLESLFPELNESYGEKIRKELIEEICYITPKQNELTEDLDTLPCYEERIERYRAWLEKQCKKLDADEVIAWLVANILDFEDKVKLFKKDFGL